MKNFIPILIPIVLGLAAVLQSGLNRNISQHFGLLKTTFINACVFLAATALILAFSMMMKSQNQLLELKGTMSEFRLWHILPALFGVALVIGLPYSFIKIGAAQTFILVIGAQLLSSALWDQWVEDIPITMTKLLGLSIAFVGVIVFNWKKVL